MKHPVYCMLLFRQCVTLVKLYILPYSNCWCTYIYCSRFPRYLSHDNINKMQITITGILGWKVRMAWLKVPEYEATYFMILIFLNTFDCLFFR
jgi:hypothetical protein